MYFTDVFLNYFQMFFVSNLSIKKFAYKKALFALFKGKHFLDRTCNKIGDNVKQLNSLVLNIPFRFPTCQECP